MALFNQIRRPTLAVALATLALTSACGKEDPKNCTTEFTTEIQKLNSSIKTITSQASADRVLQNIGTFEAKYGGEECMGSRERGGARETLNGKSEASRLRDSATRAKAAFGGNTTGGGTTGGGTTGGGTTGGGTTGGGTTGGGTTGGGTTGGGTVVIPPGNPAAYLPGTYTCSTAFVSDLTTARTSSISQVQSGQLTAARSTVDAFEAKYRDVVCEQTAGSATTTITANTEIAGMRAKIPASQPTGTNPGNPAAYDPGTNHCSQTLMNDQDTFWKDFKTALAKSDRVQAGAILNNFEQTYKDVYCEFLDTQGAPEYLDINRLILSQRTKYKL